MPKCKNLVGECFGKLTVLQREGPSKRGSALWRCQCECGSIVYADTNALRSGNKKSCGCLHHRLNQIYSLGDVSICLMENLSGELDYFWFDTSMLHIVEQYHWQTDRGGYAMSPSTVRESVKFHRLVMGLHVGDSRMVDHINGDVRDNRLCNLRFCNHAENSRHRREVKGYRKTPWGTYQASILIDGKRITLGSYDTPEEAQACYEGAARIAYGKFMPYKKIEIYYPI